MRTTNISTRGEKNRNSLISNNWYAGKWNAHHISFYSQFTSYIAMYESMAYRIAPAMYERERKKRACDTDLMNISTNSQRMCADVHDVRAYGNLERVKQTYANLSRHYDIRHPGTIHFFQTLLKLLLCLFISKMFHYFWRIFNPFWILNYFYGLGKQESRNFS